MRIEPVPKSSTEAAETFATAKAMLGWLPNTVRVMARGASAAELYLRARELNARSGLAPAERELIACLTAAHNRCEYCLTAHSIAARLLEVDVDEVLLAREGRSSAPRGAAILGFAAALLASKGRVGDEDLARARGAGLTDAELIDIVAVVAENMLGNFVNNLARTELDGPLVRAAARLLPGPTPDRAPPL
jgi:uncharacterized peroxidase-related enzyme